MRKLILSRLSETVKKTFIYDFRNFNFQAERAGGGCFALSHLMNHLAATAELCAENLCSDGYVFLFAVV